MRIIASEGHYNYISVEPDTLPPKLLTQLNSDISWCECPECRSRRIYSIEYKPRKYGYYCTECKLAYVAERRHDA
jgi:transposase-like protein